MKTRNLVIALMIAFSGNVLLAQKMDVDPEKSSIKWLGKKISYSHEGNIMFKDGFLELKDDQIVAGKFVVDMTSITNTDIEDEGRNQRLVGHLKSDDFFGVEKYPTASFVVIQASKFVNGKATVSGEITIKGKTEQITFEVEKSGNQYNSTVNIDRSKFDVRFGSDSFFDNLGDNAIADIFSLDITLVVV